MLFINFVSIFIYTCILHVANCLKFSQNQLYKKKKKKYMQFGNVQTTVFPNYIALSVTTTDSIINPNFSKTSLREFKP